MKSRQTNLNANAISSQAIMGKLKELESTQGWPKLWPEPQNLSQFVDKHSIQVKMKEQREPSLSALMQIT